MKIFKDFVKNIMEGLSESLEIDWEKNKNIWNGFFNIEDRKYHIIIEKFSIKQEHWLFKFTANKSFELQNDLKKALTVIPTIEKAANDFITEIKPECFIFMANDKSEGRKKFYEKFAINIKDVYRYNYYTEINRDAQFYYLTLDTCDEIEFATVTLPRIFKKYA
jgi:hypothetical protein